MTEKGSLWNGFLLLVWPTLRKISPGFPTGCMDLIWVSVLERTWLCFERFTLWQHLNCSLIAIILQAQNTLQEHSVTWCSLCTTSETCRSWNRTVTPTDPFTFSLGLGFAAVWPRQAPQLFAVHASISTDRKTQSALVKAPLLDSYIHEQILVLSDQTVGTKHRLYTIEQQHREQPLRSF